MRYLNCVTDDEQQALAIAEFLSPGLVPSFLPLPDLTFEPLDGLPDSPLDAAHTFVNAPPVRRDNPLEPLGYVEFDPVPGAYTTITLWGLAIDGAKRPEFQFLAIADEGLDLIAFTDNRVKNGRVGLNLKVCDPPREDVASAMSVDFGEFVQPPDRGAFRPSGVIVGLHVFDALARPLGQSCQFVPGVGVRSFHDGELPISGPRRGILPGVLDSQLIEQGIECRTEVVEPLAEDDRELHWEFRGRFDHDAYNVTVWFEPILNRVGLQVLTSESPKTLSVIRGTVDAGQRGPEISLWQDDAPSVLGR